MDTPRQDIRITKTKKALERAMLELLEKKKFKKITVNDICQQAMVSRSTFYLHFEDKYQLMFFCLENEHRCLQEEIGKQTPKEFIRSMLARIQQRKKIYKNLFGAELDMELAKMLQASFKNVITGLLESREQAGEKLAGPIPLLAAYYSAGLAGMTYWWMEAGFTHSLEEMAACQYALISPVLQDF